MSYKGRPQKLMQTTNDKTQNSAENSANSKNDNTTRVVYIAQKTQRLASALYAITRVFPVDEPLRQTLRRQALSLVSSAHMVSDGTPADECIAELPDLLKRLSSQLMVARDGGLISSMNFSVLHEEISRFIDEVKELGAYPGPSLDTSYFNSGTPALEAGHEFTRKASPTESSSVSRELAQSAPANSSNSGAKKSVSAKDKRRQQILDLFQTRSEITVNDVTDVVSGYSTKTIQRDLKALVKAGKLEKHGKRRWTSYTKA